MANTAVFMAYEGFTYYRAFNNFAIELECNLFLKARNAAVEIKVMDCNLIIGINALLWLIGCLIR